MNKSVRFFPNREEFKKPVGGVRANEEIRFNLMFSRPSNPGEVLLALTKDGEQEVTYPLSFVTVNADGMNEYTATIRVTSRGLYFYHFLVNTDTGEQYRIGADTDLNALLGKGQDWQLTVYEGAAAPKWLKGGMLYQIMTDRFFIGGERLKTKKNVVYRDDWSGTPEYRPTPEGKILNNDMFGGNLKGITKKLGYIKSLGVTCIYLNPIFEAHSNHKYDTGNYRKVDPDFGTLYDLEELIKKAAKKDIRIMLDGVFSHTGDDSIYFNRYNNYDSVGAYQSETSVYREWYNFRKWPEDYDCWWNFDILPNTVEENPAFNEYINGEDGIIRYWTRLGVAGWRLDVADELPNVFLDNAAHAAKSVDPDTIMLGEVWEDASNKMAYGNRRRYFQGGQLDSVTNYPFKEDILNFVRTGDAERLNNTVNVLINNYPKDVLDNLMNLLDTHDTARILSVLGDSGDTSTRDKRANAKVGNLPEAIKLLKMATVLQYTLPGVPCVYYGDEVGLEGFEDPFNRRPFPWENRNREILRWYKKLGAIRASERPILAEGVYKRLKAAEGVLAFTRSNGVEQLVVIVNNGVKAYTYQTEEPFVDLITMKPFKGSVPAGTGVIIKRAADVVIPVKPSAKK